MARQNIAKLLISIWKGGSFFNPTPISNLIVRDPPPISPNNTKMKVLLLALTASTASAFAPNAGVRRTY